MGFKRARNRFFFYNFFISDREIKFNLRFIHKSWVINFSSSLYASIPSSENRMSSFAIASHFSLPKDATTYAVLLIRVMAHILPHQPSIPLAAIHDAYSDGIPLSASSVHA
jgi:hypothetical protein